MSEAQPMAGRRPASPYAALAALSDAYGALPFGARDATAGIENELQAVVLGPAEQVDLPRTIRASNYYANCLKRAAAGTIPRSRVALLERYLAHPPQDVWENSWVRFPAAALGAEAREIFAADLLADKHRPEAGRRPDAGHFFCQEGSDEWIRIPISYLLKLALADTLESVPVGAGIARERGRRLLSHFSNDNTSPETHSFHVIPLQPEAGNGRAAAREAAKRFLLTQLLTMYANAKFRLASHGQRALVYFAPHPPVRQRELNDLVPDAFYRE
ncbi:MAG TPA: hypothetical protein VMG58_18720, partial [Candidatus Sulfotelmatobacter sp.]|nr:hypothetical protein [Candidatus Sulfotelmatobacter sp.]